MFTKVGNCFQSIYSSESCSESWLNFGHLTKQFGEIYNEDISYPILSWGFLKGEKAIGIPGLISQLTAYQSTFDLTILTSKMIVSVPLAEFNI